MALVAAAAQAEVLQSADLLGLVLPHLDSGDVESLRATCRAGLGAVRAHRTRASWTGTSACSAEQLVDLACYPALQELELLHWSGLTPHRGSALAHVASGLPALQQLSLPSNPDFGNAGAIALAGAGTAFSALRALNVAYTGLSGNSGVAAIAGAWHRQPARLDLTSNFELGDSGAAALARADWPVLRSLWLGECDVRDEGFVALMQANGMRALRVLDASLNRGVGSPPLGALEDGCIPELRELYLGDNNFNDEENVNAFSRAATHLRGLRVLEISAWGWLEEVLTRATLPALDTLLIIEYTWRQVSPYRLWGVLTDIAQAPWAAQLRTFGVCIFDEDNDPMAGPYDDEPMGIDAVLDALEDFPSLEELFILPYDGMSLRGWEYDEDYRLYHGESDYAYGFRPFSGGASRRLP